MWARLDDALFDHAKIHTAGQLIDAKRGRAIALGFYTAAILYSNKHLTDGYLPEAVIEAFPHVNNPLVVADALTKAGLFERSHGGFVIHDFGDYNPKAADIKRKRSEGKKKS